MDGGTEHTRCKLVRCDLHRLRHGCLLSTLLHPSLIYRRCLHLQALACKRGRQRLQAVSLQGAAHVAEIIIVLGRCNCRVADIERWLGGALRASTFIKEYALSDAFGTALSYMVASNEFQSLAYSSLQEWLLVSLLCLF